MHALIAMPVSALTLGQVHPEGCDLEQACQLSCLNLVFLHVCAHPTPGKAKYYAEVGSFLYIAIMATLPSHQRKGLGGQIMKHLTDQADAAGKPMYIEVGGIVKSRGSGSGGTSWQLIGLCYDTLLQSTLVSIDINAN